MAFCESCGSFLDDSVNFCGKCGAKTESGNKEAGAPSGSQGNTWTYGTNTGDYDANDIATSKPYAALAYLGILFFLPLVVVPQSKYGRFHANQGLIFLIVSAILGVALAIVNVILNAIFASPITIYGIQTGLRGLTGFGLVLSVLVSLAYAAIVIFFFVKGLINALGGKAEPLPIIGKFTLIK